ncbi:hypothetical protein JVT61DRAFT_11046 [Boletus reticuloceps]|uniref:Uncharacterized protein n=1 Tax=Boletus reticuloceps TaxID=495285 RepID=A0A8I2YF29_9AGAM|nr:hypothetical protein JVT61DRAFT_11046 [Boletus reticuloceps]
MIPCSTCIGSSLSIGYKLLSYKDLSGEVMMAVILVPVCTNALGNIILTQCRRTIVIHNILLSRISPTFQATTGRSSEECGPY